MGKFNPHSPDCKLSIPERVQYGMTKHESHIGWIDKVIPTGKSITGHMFLEDEDVVKDPSHYKMCGVEAKDIIKLVLDSHLCDNMTLWQAACFKDVLKYRLRAGKKGGNTEQDILKSLEYEEMWEDD